MHIAGPEGEVHFREQNQSSDEMFSPFIQYSSDSEDLTRLSENSYPQGGQDRNTTQQGGNIEHSVLEVAEAVGCLAQSSPGNWVLTNADAPVISESQSTSSVALRAAEVRPFGNRRYQLLGVSIFNPSNYQGEKVAVKGILIKDTKESRLNVTSLQMLSASCIR